MGDYGNSGAPEAGVVSTEQRREVQGDLSEMKSAAQRFEKEDEVVAPDDGLVAYVASTEHANESFLAVAGKVREGNPNVSGTVGLIPAIQRDGDKWAKFVNGVMVTDDLDIIKWCDEHTKICRRSDDPMTKGWATLKALEARMANREQLIDPHQMNADDTFPAGAVEDSLREAAAKAGSSGGELVASAEESKQSAREATAKGS